MAFGIDLWKIVLESNCSEETERDIKIGLDDLYAKAKAFDEVIELTKTEFVSEDLADSIRILVNDYEFVKEDD